MPARSFSKTLLLGSLSATLLVSAGSTVSVAIANPVPSSPPSPSGSAMTLGEARQYALDHQPLVRSALARLLARTGEARVPRAAWLPQIGATAQILGGTGNNSTASYLNMAEVDLPRIGGSPGVTEKTMSLAPAASTLVAVTIDQEVYDFGRISALIAAADARTDEARADGETVRLDVVLAVEEAFDAVLAARQILSATEAAFARALTHRDFAQAGVKSGLRPPVDLTRAEADLALAGVRRIRAQSGLVESRSTLAAAVGSESLEIDAAAAEASAATETAPASPGLAEALKLARDRNPLMAAALARVRAQHADTKAIAREMAPNVFASATVSGRAGGTTPSSGAASVPYGDGWLPDVVNWHVGLVLQWNLFDATVLARRSASEAREDQAKADLDVAWSRTRIAVERAYIALDAAQRVVPGLVESVSAAAANQGQAEARYKAGLGTIIELADAEGLLTGSTVELAIGRFAADRARAQLGRAIGGAVTGNVAGQPTGKSTGNSTGNSMGGPTR